MGQREGLSRFDLGQIKLAYENFRLYQENPQRAEYAQEQLSRISLTLDISRFDLAQRIKEIESKII